MRATHTLSTILGLVSGLAFPIAAGAAPPDIVVKEAMIAAGRLQISGTTASPFTRLRLDGREAQDFNVTSKADRSFRFSTVYLPKDCIVSLQSMPPSGASGPRAEAVVANCAAAAIAPRGNWKKMTAYEFLDLVNHRGTSWIAARDTVGGEPGKSEDWQLFAAAGPGNADAPSSGNLQASPAASQQSMPSPSQGIVTSLTGKAIPSGPAGGDLSGTYPNPSIRSGAVRTGKLADLAVTRPKIAVGAVNASRIANGAVLGTKLAADAVDGSKVLDNSLGSADIAALHGDIDIQDNTITTFDLADNSVDSDEVLDFGLSNEDVGVLFAQVNEDGTLANSSGGVTSARLVTGKYQVDFGRNISACAFVATEGDAGAGNAVGAIVGVTDRLNNVEAVFVSVKDENLNDFDRSFQLVVVC